MINFALLGAGRIGQLHAHNIINHPNSKLKFVFDLNKELSKQVAKKYKCETSNFVDDIISSSEIDAVLIASSTPTHINYIMKSAIAGKAIFCEKPIDLNIKKVDQCWNKIKKYKVPIQIGFNRRYDPGHNSIQKAVVSGKIGKLEMIVITSRDPVPPTLSYLKESGGIFRDCTIHDFDLARFILKDDPIIEVYSNVSTNVSKEISKAKDYDTAMCVLKSRKGVLIHINNSRRAIYGYDQRVEVFGSKGMLISDNIPKNNILSFNKDESFAKKSIHYFFIERYKEAYKLQLNDFIMCVEKNIIPKVSFIDGRNALLIADCATKSALNNKLVKIHY